MLLGLLTCYDFLLIVIIYVIDLLLHAHSPFTGTPRKSLLEISTTVQRSRLRTSTWSKLSSLSRCIWVEELQTPTVCCTPGPVRAADEIWVEALRWVRCTGESVRLIRGLKVTFAEVGADLFPLSYVVVKYDASLIHTDAAEPLFAPKTWSIISVLQHMVHCWCPDGENNQADQ